LTEEEQNIVDAIMEARYNAMLFGTGVIKLAVEDGKIVASVIEPKEEQSK
jgi:hypothetical protein